jgi:hypothetical protein
VLEPLLPVRTWRVINDFACGPESWGMSDYRPVIDQLAKLKFNRLLGPANVYLDSSRSVNETLQFEIHDGDSVGTGYTMDACGEGVPYDYMGTGDPALRTDCSQKGALVGRYVEVWTDAADTQRNVTAACGSFSACDDPYVPVLDAEDDSLDQASFERVSSVTVKQTPRLIQCEKACCGSASACGDAGWSTP